MCCAAARCAQRVSAQDTRENALARFSLAVSSVAVRIVAGEEAWVLGRGTTAGVRVMRGGELV